MRRVYVAGPVVDEIDKGRIFTGFMPRDPPFSQRPERRDLESLYLWIRRAAESVGWVPKLPYASAELNQLDPAKFVRHITSAINESDAVVTVFGSGDTSTTGESIIAAEHGKPQLILVSGNHNPPRIMVGQRGIAATIRIRNEAQVIFDVSTFLTAPEPPDSGERKRRSIERF